MNPLISLGIAPFSWRLGIVRSKPGKVVIGLGPLRLSLHDLSEVGDQAKLDYRTDERFVSLTYTNYKGETALRTIKPVEVWYGESPYHAGQQWFLRAFDMEKGAERDFALIDFGVPGAAVHYNAGFRAGRRAVADEIPQHLRDVIDELATVGELPITTEQFAVGVAPTMTRFDKDGNFTATPVPLDDWFEREDPKGGPRRG